MKKKEANKTISLLNFKNLREFSSFVSEIYNVSNDLFIDHIFSSLSLLLSSTKELRFDIEEFYQINKIEILDTKDNFCLENSNSFSHIRLENEYTAQKTYQIFVASESSAIVRNKFINLIRKYNTGIFRFSKNNNKQYVLHTYQSLENFSNEQDAIYDRCLYFYFSFYTNPQGADLSLINQIVYESIMYETHSPLNLDISDEFDHFERKISKIKKQLQKYFGEQYRYNEILTNPDPLIEQISLVYENLFCINQLYIHNLFTTNDNDVYPDDLLLAIAMSSSHFPDDQFLAHCFIGGIFIKEFIKEYQEAKQFFYQHQISADITDEKNLLQEEIITLKAQVDKLEAENRDLLASSRELTEKASKEIDILEKEKYNDMSQLQQQVKKLTAQLASEKRYHQELYRLREVVFSKDLLTTAPSNTGEPSQSIPLAKSLTDKNIIVVGGAKNWRHKLMESCPQIRSISASNLSIDLNVFKQVDFVLFFTNHISHSVYNRVMNYIRNNDIPFGYIKTTNLELLEVEIQDLLKRSGII